MFPAKSLDAQASAQNQREKRPNGHDLKDKTPPRYLRLPKAGERCRFTGLCRSFLNGLILPTKANGHKPPVRSAVLKLDRNATRGVRLIDTASLLSWIEKHEVGGEEVAQ